MTRLFSKLYDRVLIWSRHPRAPQYLGALSFAESSFFPIPPDVMLAPMVLAQPKRAWYLASLTTITSVVGGILGFAIGVVAGPFQQGFDCFLGLCSCRTVDLCVHITLQISC